MTVHDVGHGPRLEDVLFAYPITGHYRFGHGIPQPTPETESAPSRPDRTDFALISVGPSIEILPVVRVRSSMYTAPAAPAESPEQKSYPHPLRPCPTREQGENE